MKNIYFLFLWAFFIFNSYAMDIEDDAHLFSYKKTNKVANEDDNERAKAELFKKYLESIKDKTNKVAGDIQNANEQVPSFYKKPSYGSDGIVMEAAY